MASTNNMPDILTVARSSIIKKHIERQSAIQEELKDILGMLSEPVLEYISRTGDGRDNDQVSRAYCLKKISEGKTKKEAIPI